MIKPDLYFATDIGAKATNIISESNIESQIFDNSIEIPKGEGNGKLFVPILTIIALHRQIDALLLGDESAASLGVNVEKLRLLMLGLCAALTATIVAYCGGIGFVGLMIPHVVRQLIGVTTLKLIIGSALVGAIFLIWVDVIARSSLPHAEIPLGIITSAMGSVFFLFIMYRARANN